MATGRLKVKRVIAPAGGYFFSVAELAFTRIVKVMRENAVNYFFEGGASAVGKRVRFLSTEGKFVFDISNPFGNNELITIIYKDPL
jgi:hypothetical protein